LPCSAFFSSPLKALPNPTSNEGTEKVYHKIIDSKPRPLKRINGF
jgi:hypothetical protein